MTGLVRTRGNRCKNTPPGMRGPRALQCRRELIYSASLHACLGAASDSALQGGAAVMAAIEGLTRGAPCPTASLKGFLMLDNHFPMLDNPISRPVPSGTFSNAWENVPEGTGLIIRLSLYSL